MSEETIEHHDQPRRKRPPKEEVNASEYEAALTLIRHFSELDINEIKYWEDLAERLGPVSQAIEMLVLANGTAEDDQYRLIRDSGNARLDFRVLGWEPASIGRDLRLEIRKFDDTRKSTRRTALKPNLEIVLFTDTHLGGVDPTGLRIIPYAAIERQGQFVSYYPATDPNNGHLQRQFGLALQEAVTGLLEVVPSPNLKGNNAQVSGT